MRIIMLALGLLAFSGTMSQVKKINAETNINQVIIYFAGARIERRTLVNLPAGKTEISFSGLSNQLDPQTIQLKSESDITLLSVQTTRDFLSARKMDQEEKTLTDKFNLLNEKSGQDKKLLEIFKNEEAILQKNQSIGGTSGVKAADLKETLDLQRQRLTEIYTKQTEIQKRLDGEEQEKRALSFQIQEISRKKDSISFLVTALIDSKTAGSVPFELTYNVKDAGWYPTYNVRINELDKPLDVLINANVFQRSGETWKNVSLLLSTGDPNDNATQSPLQPWHLGFFDGTSVIRSKNLQGVITGRVTDESQQPVAGASVTIKENRSTTVTDVNGFFRLNNAGPNNTVITNGVGYHTKELIMSPGYVNIQMTTASTALNEVEETGYTISQALEGRVAGVSVSDAYAEKKRIQTVQVISVIQPTTTVFKIDEKYSIETDGKTNTIGIKQLEIAASFDYYCAPKIDPDAFLTARINNWQDYELLSGEASLFFEGTYLGKTYIDLGTAGDTLSLSLGKDNGVSISRKLVKEYSAKKFMGSNRSDSRDYEIIVRNYKKVPVTITIPDQFPVSVTKDINVDDLKAPEALVDKETGLVVWNLKLTAGQERRLKISYTVKYPKDRKVMLD